jgi:hypothetical protein
MTILNIQTQPPAGQTAVTSSTSSTQSTLPNLIYILTDDTYAEVTATGYLTSSKAQGNSFANNQMALVYTTDEGPVWLKVVITYSGASVLNTVVSLVEISSPGSVALPTITNHLMVSTNTSGDLANLTGTAINNGSLQAGLSGTAGSLISYPATASKGALIVSGVANTGNTNVTISNAAHGQATVYSIGDIGASTGGLVAATSAISMKSVAAAAAAGGAAAQSFTDAFCTSGSVVIGNWVAQTNAASVLKIVPGTGSFVVTSSADAGVGTFSYIIIK